MARTSLFTRLRIIAAQCRAARDEGLTDPKEITAWVRAQPLPRRTFTRGLLGAAVVTACGDDGSAEGTGTSSSTDPSTTEPTTTTMTTDVDTTGSSSSDTQADTTTGEPGMARVAVVGGGMAGLHCAYRLHEAGVDVTVYESSDRTGGRMFTARKMFDNDQVAELGGEFIDSVHLTLLDLATELEIELDDREASFDETTIRDTWWVDGVAVPNETVVEQFSMVAGVMAEQVLAADTDDKAYAMLDLIPLSTWLDDNVPTGMYPELHAILASAYRGEYGREIDDQSALNLLYLIGSDTPDEFRIFGVSDERYHTHLGSDTFTTALAAGLDGVIQTGMTLTAARDGEGGVHVLVFDGPDGEVEVEADHIVFALPFTRLRGVDLSALTLSDDKRQIIDELGYGTNAKVMGGFTSRVWREMYDASGSATTDLPAQQFWDTSIGQAGDTGIITNYLGGEQGVASGRGEAEAWFTDVALPDLETVFPGAEAAYVAGSAVRMHWPSHPHTLGSYGCYRPGQWAFYGVEGEREGNVHFCGEHTSLEFQGYMEGAAETGLLVATAILGDLGLKMSDAHRRIADRLLVRPQPHVQGRLAERPRWL
jgi:monoamine oxidase